MSESVWVYVVEARPAADLKSRGCCYLIRGCLPLYQKLLMKPCCNTLWASQQSPELHPNKDVISIQPMIVLLAMILAFKCWNSLQSVTQAFAPTWKTFNVRRNGNKKGLGWNFSKCAGKHFVQVFGYHSEVMNGSHLAPECNISHIIFSYCRTFQETN